MIRSAHRIKVLVARHRFGKEFIRSNIALRRKRQFLNCPARGSRYSVPNQCRRRIDAAVPEARSISLHLVVLWEYLRDITFVIGIQQGQRYD